MKRSSMLSVVILFIIGLGFALITGPSRNVSTTDLPKDMPIVNGKIISARTFRSDDLQRGIEIVIKTNLSLQEVAQYYSDEFKKRDIRVLTLPTFQGDSRELENSTAAEAVAETRSRLGIVVSIRSEKQFTRVTIQVKGNSILFLPS